MKKLNVIGNRNVNLDDLETWEIAEMYELDDVQEEILKAALDAGFNAEDAVNKILTDRFNLVENVTTYEDLGYYYAEEDLPDYAYAYFDFERFGAALASTEDGCLTSYGWLTVC